ncbi:MAG: homocitrate synthase/isopropylmalate synthase family protein [Chloroflexota bacterium]
MIGEFSILDTTLREGEQFANTFFRSKDRIDLAKRLDAFGVEHIEVSSPVVSDKAGEDIRALRALNLRAKVFAHCRCEPSEVMAALDCGAQGINLYQGSSMLMRLHSHGRSLEEIISSAVSLIGMLKERGVFVRFSAEDAFRTEVADLTAIFDPICAAGVDRIGLPDTTGVATPTQVMQRVSFFRERYGVEIEFHVHNDTGCAVANALTALESGANCIDTTVLGIGERNGITSLSGLVARLYSVDRQLVRKYGLPALPELDRFVAELVGVPIPFNAPITGATAFTHKAGVHTNAVLRQPQTYEALDPADFGLQRSIQVASRITGKAAIRYRASELGIELGEADLRQVTRQIKSLADERPICMADVDNAITSYCAAVAG